MKKSQLPITEDMKRILTIDKMNAVRKLWNSETIRDQHDFDWEAATALSHGCNFSGRILEVKSEIALNHRIWNFYDEGTEDVDVWLNVIACNSFDGFYIVGAYLSDIWSFIGNLSEEAERINEEIRSHMYIRHFVEKM